MGACNTAFASLFPKWSEKRCNRSEEYETGLYGREKHFWGRHFWGWRREK